MLADLYARCFNIFYNGCNTLNKKRCWKFTDPLSSNDQHVLLSCTCLISCLWGNSSLLLAHDLIGIVKIIFLKAPYWIFVFKEYHPNVPLPPKCTFILAHSHSEDSRAEQPACCMMEKTGRMRTKAMRIDCLWKFFYNNIRITSAICGFAPSCWKMPFLRWPRSPIQE